MTQLPHLINNITYGLHFSQSERYKKKTTQCLATVERKKNYLINSLRSFDKIHFVLLFFLKKIARQRMNFRQQNKKKIVDKTTENVLLMFVFFCVHLFETIV